MQPSLEPNYRSYLLRLWRADENAPWRASLVSPRTGETLGFATLDGLCNFLHHQVIGEADPQEIDPSDSADSAHKKGD